MERSGHLSINGVRSYERTSEAQKNEVSEIISTCKPLQEMSTNIQANETHPISNIATKNCIKPDKENIFDIKDLHGCTININFNK